MNRKRAIVACSVGLAVACTTVEDFADEWEVEEPPSEAESQNDDEPSYESGEPACPEVTDEWESDDLAMRLYHDIACDHGRNENFIFSPAAARLSLGEWAWERSGYEGEELARRLGYEVPQGFAVSLRHIRPAHRIGIEDGAGFAAVMG